MVVIVEGEGVIFEPILDLSIYLSSGKFKFFESAGILSLALVSAGILSFALVNKIEKFSYLQHTLPEKLFLLDRSISKECRNFVFRSRE